MWKSGADIFIVTGNSFLRKDGCLAMGRGSALEALTLFPGCNKVFGDLIRQVGDPYGVLVHPTQIKPGLALFQVKHNFRDNAELGLIQNSTNHLMGLCQSIWRDKQITMNFPGIGWGHLQREVVLPILQVLPDNVSVWEYK